MSRRLRMLPVLLATTALLPACRQDMHDQPYFEPLEATDFFGDRRAERPRVPGTVARGELNLDTHLLEGKVGGKFAETYPFEVTRDLLERGKERYEIFCTHCHDALGYGDGMIVRRGMKRPPSYHIPRLRDAAPGYVVHVITHGFGAMYDHADRIKPSDRWAIAAYVKTLQRSQLATLDDVQSAEERRRLEGERE